MRQFAFRKGCLVAVAILATASASAQTPIPIANINRSETIDFEQEILPIFKRSCLACHSESAAFGGLVLETPETIRKGGDSGPAVMAKKSAASLLLKVAARQSEPVMPPPDNEVGAKALTSQELGLLKLWIDQGATGTVRGIISPKTWRPLPPKVNPIFATALTRDGQFAACGRANQIFIYHVPTGQLMTRLTDPSLVEESDDPRPGIAHRDLVQSLTFNRQGNLLASGGFRTIKLWRRPRDVRPLELAVPEAVTAVAVSPDRSLLATASADNTIQLWNRKTGETALTLERHTAEITALSFLADGQQLVSSSVDKTVRFWNLENGTLSGRIDTPSEINDLTLLANGSVATSHEDQFARYWSLPDALSSPPREVLENSVALAVSPDGQFVASADAEGRIRVTDIGCGQLLDRSWPAHEGPIVGLSFSGEGRRLTSAGADGAVRVWDYETGEAIAPALWGTLGELTTVALRADGKEVTAATAEGEISVWSLEAAESRLLTALPQKETPKEETEPSSTENSPPPLSANGIPATAIAVSPDGKLLAASGEVNGRSAILVRELETGQLQHRLTGHTKSITSLAFAADNARLLSGSEDGTARLWNLADPKFPEVLAFGEHQAAVTGVAFNSDGSQAATCAANQTVHLWNTATGEVLQSFAGHTAAMAGIAFTPDNKHVITAAADKTVRIWTAADGELARTITATAAITQLAVRPDGTRIAVSLADNSLALYNTADGALLHNLKGQGAEIQALSFSKDGTRLLSTGADQAMVWQSENGRLLEILPCPESATTGVFGPTADQIVLAYADASITQQALRFKTALGDMEQAVTKVLYSADGSVVASCADGTIRRFTPANGNQVFAANHGAAVHDIALTPNGQLLASAATDQSLKLWTASNGNAQPNPQLSGFQAAVGCAAFSRDGTRLVASDASGEARVFHVASRSLEQVHRGHKSPVHSLVCAGDDLPLVISATGQEVGQWQLLQRRRLGGHSMPLTSVAGVNTIPPQIVTGSLDGTVRQWNLETGQAVRTMNHGAPVTDVAVRPDGQRFASAAENNTARLWNAASGASVAELKGDIRALNLVARTEQELALVTKKVEATNEALTQAQAAAPMKAAAAKTAADALTAANTAVTKADAALKKAAETKAAAEQEAVQAAAAAQTARQAKLEADKAAALATAQSKRAAEKAARAKAAAQAAPDDATLAAKAKSAEQAATAAETKEKTAKDEATKAEAAAKNAADTAATAAQQAVVAGKPYLEALETFRERKATQNTASQASALAASEAKKAAEAVPLAEAALKTAQERMTTLTAAVEKAKDTALSAEQPIRTVAFSPDNQLLASGGDSGALHTWSAENGRAIASFHGHEAQVQEVVFASASELFSGAANAAFVWNAEPGWILERRIGSVDDPSILADRVMDLDFNADASLLVAGGGVATRFGEVKVFQVADGKSVRSLPEPHTDGVLGVAFSPDGSRLATGSADKYVKVFEAATGKFVRSFEGHTDYVLDVAWRGDGRSLASCGADNTLRVWNAETGELTRTITGFEKQVTDVRFIGDSINAVSSSGDKSVRMHRTDNGQNFRNFAGGADYMFCVDATPDSQFVIAGGFDSVLRVWNGTNGQAIHELAPPNPKPSTEIESSAGESQ